MNARHNRDNKTLSWKLRARGGHKETTDVVLGHLNNLHNINYKCEMFIKNKGTVIQELTEI